MPAVLEVKKSGPFDEHCTPPSVTLVVLIEKVKGELMDQQLGSQVLIQCHSLSIICEIQQDSTTKLGTP